jgi:Ca-activated chloride channel family protein
MLSFHSKGFLALFLLIPIIVAWYIFRDKSLKGSIRYSDITMLKGIGQSVTLRLRHVLVVFRILAISCFILALARPQRGISEEEILTSGVDIVMLLDVSTSMKAMDFKPNRLGAAKKVVAEFIKNRKSDRIGLVVFSAKAFTQCPLTLDYGVLLSFLENVTFTDPEDDGTAIGVALATAANRLRESKAKTKLMILLTDGKNTAGDLNPVTAARAVATQDIRVYTVGAGQRGRAPYPFQHPLFGTQIQYIDDSIDENVLKEIAEVCGAKFFRAQNREKLAEIYNKIDQMEKTDIKVKSYMHYRERFGLFLLVGMLFLAMEIVLANTRFKKIP